jgi:hypothetical protein
MTVFKVGDKVRVITGRYGEDQFGDVGYIARPYSRRHDYTIWRVEFTLPGCINKHGIPFNTYHDKDLKLVIPFEEYNPNQEPEDDCI